jgi:hypothetical protein
MDYMSTRDVAKVLGVNPSRLARALWTGRIQEPQRGPSGNFLWVEADVRRACWVLLRCDLDDLRTRRQGGGDHD